MIPGAVRALTGGETALARDVFGDALDARRVRIAALPAWRRAFVAGPSLVFWPARSALRDFSLAGLSLQAILVHELVHVWQAQSGVNLLAAKLKAGTARTPTTTSPWPAPASGTSTSSSRRWSSSTPSSPRAGAGLPIRRRPMSSFWLAHPSGMA